jgi:hypothetical protein
MNIALPGIPVILPALTLRILDRQSVECNIERSNIPHFAAVDSEWRRHPAVHQHTIE